MKAIFSGDILWGIILLIVYIFGMLDETYKKVREQIRNKEGTWLKKLFS